MSMRRSSVDQASSLGTRCPASSGGRASGYGSWVIAVMVSLATAVARSDGDGIALDEETAFTAAAARVAPTVVRIEAAGVSAATLSGPAEASPASGPSSGVVVGADGWIVATSFAVPKDVDQVVATLADGTRHVARVTGRDLSRGLVLLRVTLPAGSVPLEVPEAAPRDSWRVGQWTLALGRAWSAARPSVGVGILSATNRAWGKAIQTDASVSPANYGGPLVDIQGRVMGVLAPLPAETAGMTAGTELYDSGIGFAVPLEDILRVLPRLQSGETLASGVIGVGYASRDPFTAPPLIATCRAGSPASKAGLLAGDRIVEADGRPVTRVAQLRHVLAPKYAGDTVDLVVERGDDRRRMPFHVELVAALPPWRRSVLGIVPRRVEPRRVDAQAKPADSGVVVDWVWPEGPAAKAGIVAGDRIVTAARAGGPAGEEGLLLVGDPAALAGFVAGLEAGDVVDLAYERAGERSTVGITLTPQPALPPANVPSREGDPEGVVIEKLTAAEIARPVWVVVPPVDAATPLGVLVYCGPPGAGVAPQAKAAEAEAAARRSAERWKVAAARHGVAVVLAASADAERWGREDIPILARSLDGLRLKRPIDPTRVAFAGSGPGGAFAWLAAEALGPAIRGVALLDATLPRQASVVPTEPGASRTVLFGSLPGAAVTRVDADIRRLEAAGYPVGILPELVGDALPVETLCSWVESLGVL